MKWLVIIAVLIIVAVAMVWLRTARQGSDAPRSGQRHRLDESVAPAGDADNPLPPGGSGVVGSGAGGAAAEPPSSSTWASEEAGSDGPGPHEDLPPSETRPQA
jgi:hypothetical protein